ncbi:glycosyltransferase family 32 protein [Rhizobium sp. PAMB 3182]
MKIPKRLGHIWIGPKRAPMEWMQSWTEKHPGWEYAFYDDDWVRQAGLETQPQIDEYMKRGWYAGAADLIRYEILFRNGGYIAGADSICIHPIDELFHDDGELYTVYENEFLRGQLVAPIVAAASGHPFLRLIIDTLKARDPLYLDHPWRETGNLFVAEMIEKHQPDIVIWPSHVLIPEHFTGRAYRGDGKVYARQMFGETVGAYESATLWSKLVAKRAAVYASLARKRLRRAGKFKKL